MKSYITTLLLASFISGYAQSQITSSGMGAEFKQLSGLGTRQSGFEGIRTYHSNEVKGSQFFNEPWSTGAVVTTGNDTIAKGYVFLLDKVRHELFIKPRDSTVILLADKSQVRSFIINTDRPHLFEPAAKYDPDRMGKFIEVLVNAPGGVTLLKFTQTKFIKADTKDMEKMKSGDFYDEFADNTSYYFYFNKTISSKLSFNENTLAKRLAPYKNKVNDFFRNHNESNIDENLLIGLVKYINE